MLICQWRVFPLHIVGINGKGDVVIFVNGFNIGQSDFGSLLTCTFASHTIKYIFTGSLPEIVVWREFGEVGNFVRFRVEKYVADDMIG